MASCSSFQLTTVSANASDSGDNDENLSFDVMTESDIVADMQKFCNEVNKILKLPLTTTLALLIHFSWDKDKLMESYWCTEPAEFFDKIGLPPPSTFSKKEKKNKKRSLLRKQMDENGGRINCQICCSLRNSIETIGMTCGHRFCLDCWCAYLTTKILDDGEGPIICCPDHDCHNLVDNSIITSLVQDPGILATYLRHKTDIFVLTNKWLQWCPSPSACSNVLRLNSTDHLVTGVCLPVTCPCGHKFCFHCSQTWHDPIRCDLYAKWVKKLGPKQISLSKVSEREAMVTQNKEMGDRDDDVASLLWIAQNAKNCPKCRVPIEKMGGCNYIVCKQCLTEFCWLCLRIMIQRHTHPVSCNTRTTPMINQVGVSTALVEAATKFNFCRIRFLNHKESLKHEHRLYDSVQQKMEQLQIDFSVTSSQAKFFIRAVDILQKCRQFLMHTYIFAYYLSKGDNQAAIFEKNQDDLQSAAELLSSYLERETEVTNFLDYKSKICHKSEYCESRRLLLLQHLKDGYENGFWIFKEDEEDGGYMYRSAEKFVRREWMKN